MKYIASALLILILCTALSSCKAGAVAEMPAPESTDPVTAPALDRRSHCITSDVSATGSTVPKIPVPA